MDPGPESSSGPASPNQGVDTEPDRDDPYLDRVLRVVRDFALECGGPRGLQAVEPEASLVGDVGLGSLEQVELGLRLEQAFGVQLGDEALALDTPKELARALREARATEPPIPAREAPTLPGAAAARADGASTLHEALRMWADAEPIRPHVFLRGEHGAFGTLTYGELWDGAAAIAGGIRERGIDRGETVALMLPTGVDFLRAFMGILLAGAIPVPLYPPARLARLEDYLRRQRGILDNAEARLLITEPRALPVVRVIRGSIDTRLAASSADDLAREGEALRSVSGSSSDPALIQYTSGSTGAPKGVLLSHAALLANLRAVADHMEMTSRDVGVSWLPLYHDMGLIGTWLNCLCHGVPLALMSPLDFLGRPDRWLWTIHRFRGTLSAAPNFGYELTARKTADDRLEGLDLSCWRCALNGSEPVSPETVERFTRRFEGFGFRPEAMMPAYGLAESAVALCLSPRERAPVVDRIARAPFEEEGRAEPAAAADSSPHRFVSMGSPLPGHEVKVVDEMGEGVPDRRMGRLLFRGPSSMEGYYRRPDLTRQVVRPEGWIDTGDLGYTSNGDFFVTGRAKDLIIKAGRNLVPEEIEDIVASVDGIRRGCVAALGVPDPESGTERLVVVAETRVADPHELRSLEGDVIRRISEAIDLPPDEVVLGPPRSVPKTSSGKIRRTTARAWLEEGRLGDREGPSLRMKLEFLRSRSSEILAWLWAKLRRGAYAGYFALAAPVIVLLVGVPAWILVWLVPGPGAALRLERWVSRLALRVVGLRTTVTGLENLPLHGPAILAVNHTSYVDIPALLAHLPLEFRMVAKEEVLDWPFVGTFVRRAKHPTVDRWDFEKSVEHSREIRRRLEAGQVMLFFPEGTFVRAAGLRPFRLGAFQTAVETGIPVTPIALRGTRRALPSGAILPHPGSIHIWIGEPLEPRGVGWNAAIELRARTAGAIANHSGEPRLETVVGGPIR